MIRNKLSELIFEREVKIVKMSKDTGLSRNTITNTASNTSEMLHMSTINKICNYFQITPCDFFEYTPSEFSFFVSADDDDLFISNAIDDEDNVMIYGLELDVLIEVEESGFKATYYGKLSLSNGSLLTLDNLNKESVLKLKLTIEDHEIFNYLIDTAESLSLGFKKLVYKKLIDSVQKYLIDHYKDTELHYKDADPDESINASILFEYTNIDIESNIFTKY